MQPQRPPRTVTEQLRQHSLMRTQYETSLQNLQSDLTGAAPSLAGLPVLEAFQRFLEIERRKNKRRILGLMLASVSLIVVLGVVAALLGMLNVQRTAVAVRDIEGSVDTFGAEARAAYQRAEELARGAMTKSTALQGSVTEEAGVRVESDRKLAAYIKDQQTQLAAMREKMLRMEGENARVLSELDVLRERLARRPLPPVPPSPAAIVATGPAPTSTNAAAPAVQSPVAPTGEEAELQELAEMPGDTIVIGLSLRPAGTERRVPWRVPLP